MSILRWFIQMIIGIGGFAISRPVSVSAFVPSQISGLTIWLKADAGITKDGSDRVSNWNDQSGNNNNFAQATSTAKPLFTANAKNGLPAIVFDGTSDHMTSAAFTLGTFSLFAVVSRKWQTAAYAGLFMHNLSATTGQGLFTTSSSVYGWNSAEFVVSGNGFQDTQSPRAIGPYGLLTNDTYQLISTGCGASGTFLKLNKTSVARTTTNASITAASAIAAIGTDTPALNADWWDGGIAELLIYNSVLSAGDIAKVETYLSSRWAI